MTPQLYDLPLPDGTTVKSAMNPLDMGLGMAAPPPAPDKLASVSDDSWMAALPADPTAPPKPPPSRLDAGGAPSPSELEARIRGAGSYEGKQAPGPGSATAPAGPPTDLVRVGGGGGGSQPGPAQDPTARDANEYAEYLMRGSPGRGGRVVRTPEHDALRSFQIERGPQMSDEDMQAQQDADIDRRLAGQGVADAEKAKLQGEVTAAAQRNLQDEVALIEDRAHLEAKEADIQSSIDAKVKQRDEELAAIRGMKVDPNRFFADRGVPGGILAVLAMAFGGAQSGLTGGPNWAAQEISKMVDRDIDAQVQAIANAKDAAEATQTDLGRLYAQHGDLDLAKAELRQRQHAVAEAMAANFAKRAAIPEVDARYQQWLADDSAAAAKRDADYRMAAQGARREMWEHVPERTQYLGGGGRKPVAPEEAYRRAAEWAKNKRAIDGGPDGGKAPEMAQYRVRDPETGDYLYMPKAQAAKAQDLTDKVAGYEEKAAQAKALLAKRDSWGPKERAEYKALVNGMTTDAKDIKQMGALSDSDRELVERGEEAAQSPFSWEGAKRAARGDWRGVEHSQAEIDQGVDEMRGIRKRLLQRGFKDPSMVGEAAADPIPSARSEE